MNNATVRVYRNSRLNKWAVVKVGSRKVAFYADELTLKDATFHTGLKGKHRVCKSGHVNRHNYVEGKLTSLFAQNRHRQPCSHRTTYYAPVDVEFVTKTANPNGTKQEVLSGKRVEFTNYGERYVSCGVALCGSTNCL
jgi:hypothetical protein